MNEYQKNVTYRVDGFSCGKLFGDGCETWLDDSIMVLFDGVVYIKGELRAVYKIIEPHVCSVCGKVSETFYKKYGMDEVDEDKFNEAEDAIEIFEDFLKGTKGDNT